LQAKVNLQSRSVLTIIDANDDSSRLYRNSLNSNAVLRIQALGHQCRFDMCSLEIEL